MNFTDAISTADLDAGDYEPRGCCLDCGADLPTAETLCEDCEEKRESFDVNGADPRR